MGSAVIVSTIEKLGVIDIYTTTRSCCKEGLIADAWVEIYDKITDKVIHTYCGLNSNQELENLSFSVAKDSIDYYLGKVVYVVVHDRNCGVKYVSNSIWTNPYKRTSEN
jgi:hypothetical protein